MSSSPMKARSPHSSVVMDETLPLLQIKDLNVNLQRFRVLAKISMLGPVMKNDSGKQADILHFRLLDSTGEISASVHSFMAENWIKYLTLDKTFMFQAKKDVRYPSFEIIKKDEATEERVINFNFLSKVKPMYNVNMPDIGYSNLIKVTSSDPNSCFNFVVEINDCLPSNGPNEEYDVMQQQFKIQDNTKADIDMIVKGNALVPRMKTFKPKNEKRMIVRILHGQLEKMYPEDDDGENAESEITIIVDQKKSNIEVLEDSSPLKISFLAKNSAFKRGHDISDEDEAKATPEKKKK